MLRKDGCWLFKIDQGASSEGSSTAVTFDLGISIWIEVIAAVEIYHVVDKYKKVFWLHSFHSSTLP